MTPQEIELPLSQIEVDPENIRTEYDPDVVAGLRQALEVSGEYINPPVVYPVGENRYRVKHGSTRVLAAQGIRKTIRVRLGDPPSNESNKLLSQMSENLLQGSLRPADTGQALKRLRHAEGRERSISQVVGALKAVGINRTKSWVLMHLALAELAPEVQALINRGQLPAEAGYQLRVLPIEEQIPWGHRIVREGLTREELRRQLGLAGDEDEDGNSFAAERIHRELDDRLRGAADRLRGAEGNGHSRQQPTADRRNGRVTTRLELVPVELNPEDRRQVHNFDASEWAQQATDAERQLAHEALFFGGYSPKRAIQLADRAVHEAAAAADVVLAALNTSRLLLERSAELSADSALGELLALRMKRVLHNLGRD